MKTLLALDPGETTGVSIWRFDDFTPLTHIAHHQCDVGLEGLLWFLMPQKKLLPFDMIIAESFRLDGRTPNPNTEPLKIEGALEILSIFMEAELIFQPNNFKKHISNAKLKEFNLYWPGQQHAMDSARHALAWAKIHHRLSLDKYFGTIEE